MMRLRAPRITSLRQRFLLVVVLGAVLPLALVGWWLTRAAVRSGQAQLAAQLDSTLAAITDRVQQRWVMRRGDLILLADNEVVRRTLGRARPTGADSSFMVQLSSSVQRSTPVIRYRAVDGAVPWSFDATPPLAQDSMLSRARQIQSGSEVTFLVRSSVRGWSADSTHAVGQMEAHVSLASVLPTEESQSVVGRAVLTVIDRSTNSILVGANAGNDWAMVRRTLDQPPLDLRLSAPATAYVKPFEHAAQLGLVALVVVAALVVLLTTYLTTRLTGSLEELVDATTAVARGDLQRNVPTRGNDEFARLADAFNAMTESLRRTLHELSRQQALAAVGEFAATLSHEIRNALSAVRMDLQRAEERANDPPRSRELVTRALQNVRRLDLIVSGALRVARQGENSAQRVDLHAILQRAIASAEPTFATAEAVLESGLNGGPPLWVNGDAVALEQLFLNLLVNAGQALSAGGRARVEAHEENESHVITIHDGGIGISNDQLARIGEPFYSSKHGGTGLGLTITRRIVAAHGGQMGIESESGRGTLVRVSLPRAVASNMP